MSFSNSNYSIEEIFKNQNLFTKRDVWIKKRKETDYDTFYSELLKVAKKHYMDYATNNEFTNSYKNPIYYVDDIPELSKELSDYVCKKSGIMNTTYNKYKKTCEDVQIIYVDLLEYLYLDNLPTIIADDLIDTITTPKTITVNDNVYYNNNNYFIWRKKNDPYIVKPQSDLQITKDNFNNFSTRRGVGWSMKQIQTFFFTTIIPYILKEADLKININLPAYKEVLKKYNFKYLMGGFINEYFKNNNKLDLNIEFLQKNYKKIESNQKSLALLEISKIHKTNVYHHIYKLIIELKVTQVKVLSGLESKIKKIKERIEQKKLPKKYTYHWQRMCAKLTSLDIEELREIAEIEGIPYYNMKSKRELCQDFSEKLEKMIVQQRRQKIRYTKEDSNDPNNIHNNLTNEEKQHIQRYPELYSKKCHNDDSVLSSDNVSDIKQEFLFTYEHNGKIWCDDIRALYKYVIEQGVEQHPFDRTPLSEKLIDLIRNTYEKLEKTMVTLEDSEEVPQLSKSSILTSKTTSLISLLYHPNPVSLFLESSSRIFNEFLMYLEDEDILSQREISNILNLKDLLDKKIVLVDLLTLKITNDTDIIDGVSSMAVNITNVYNSVFSRD